MAVVVGLMATLLAGVLVPLPAGAATGADLDQCANGPLAAPVNCSLDSQWDNGNLNASKAHYAEGDSLPYRLIMTGLTAGEAYTTTIEWDTTKGGKHALDYITTFDRTVTGADPCAGVTGCGGVPDTFPIPADSNVTGAGVAQIPGVFTLFGGTITGVSPYTLTGTYAGDSSTRITVTFVASAETAVLAWGGHISTRPDWGVANSAAAITGSPYHTRLIEFDGKGGNQDRSLAAAAVVFPASITIIKDAVPDDAQDFNFTTTGGLTPTDFVLDDDPNSATSNTQTFADITTFTTYTITEAAAAGWTLSFGTPVCTVTSPNGGSQAAAASTVTIDLREGENVTCTFTNTRQTGTLTVNKVVVPAVGDAGRFDLQIDGATAGTGADVGHLGTTGAVIVGTGDHTVGEIAAGATDLGDYTSTIACTGGEVAANAGPLSVNVSNGENVVCTITNIRQTGTLTVNKVVVPADDPGRFNLLIDGTIEAANIGNGGSTGAVSVNTGVHTVAETAMAGTDLADYITDISCTDGSVLMGSAGPLAVTVTNDVNVTCTITNTRRTGTITVNKVVVGDSGDDAFNLQIDGTTAGTGANVGNGGTTGQIVVPTGIHNVGELAGLNTDLADYAITIVCSGEDAAVGAGPVAVTVGDGEDVVCTITNTRRTGSITVNKVVVGDSDDDLFDLQVDGTTEAAGVGDGGTTGEITVPTGAHDVGEVAGMNTDLADYAITIVCSGEAPAVGAGPVAVTVGDGEDVVCTITNTRRTGTITVNKVVVGDAGDDGFNLLIDGAAAGTGANVGNGGSTGTVAVNTGVHTVAETAVAGTDLADYITDISCTDGSVLIGSAGPLAVTVANDVNVTCTITNTRRTGTITVNKVVVGDAGDDGFNLQIDGATAGTGANVGDGGTTGAITLPTGVHTVGETAGPGTSLADYTTTIVCGNGPAVPGTSTTVTLAGDDAVTCTITNVRRPDDEEPCRQAASRKPNPCVEDDDDGPTDVDDLVINQPAPNTPTGPVTDPATDPVTDPGAGVAGDTNHGAPAPEQVLPAETSRPEPAPVSGFLPRTGAGIIGQALLAWALIGAGLVLRLARRRRTAETRG